MAGTEASLIVRTWFDRGNSPAFRARILGVRLDDPTASQVATSPDEVVKIVRSWLDALLRAEAATVKRPRSHWPVGEETAPDLALEDE
ncbi:MAG: hypothetical protein ACREQ5_01325 [Candidatus Dormibacteria bacterium]